MDFDRTTNSSKRNVTVNANDVDMIVNSVGEVTVVVKRPKTDLPPIDNPLTPGHRAELKELIEKWVGLSQYLKKPITFAAAWSMLNKQAKSMGKVGVTTINHYPDCDFEKGKKFIQKEIAKLNKNTKVKNSSPTWRSEKIKSIQARCKSLGIGDEKRRSYMENRFGVGKNSLTKLTDNEIEEMYSYVWGSSPKFEYKQPQVPLQKIREKALSDYIDIMEKNSNGAYFNRQSIPMTRSSMLDALQAREPTLFGELSPTSFNHFWNKQQICKLAAGKPKGSWQQ